MKIERNHLIILFLILLGLALYRSGVVKFFESLYTSGTGWQITNFYFNKPILLKPEPLKASYEITYQVQYYYYTSGGAPVPVIPPLRAVICIDGNCREQKVSDYITTGSPWRSEVRKEAISFDIPTELLSKGFHDVEVYIAGLGSGYYWDPQICHTSNRVWTDLGRVWKPYYKPTPPTDCEDLDSALNKLDWVKIVQDAKENKLPKNLKLYVWYSKPYKVLICEGSISTQGCGLEITKIVEKEIDCRTTGCPEGYECNALNNTYVCMQKQSKIDMTSVLVLLAFILIILLVVWRVKK